MFRELRDACLILRETCNVQTKDSKFQMLFESSDDSISDTSQSSVWPNRFHSMCDVLLNNKHNPRLCKHRYSDRELIRHIW